jgi:hypothetical protein
VGIFPLVASTSDSHASACAFAHEREIRPLNIEMSCSGFDSANAMCAITAITIAKKRAS